MSEDKLAAEGVKALERISAESIKAAAGVIKSLYGASKSNPLLGVAAYLFTIDLFQKLGLIWPNTAQSAREALFTALGLQFRTQDLSNVKVWESNIPVLGWFVAGTNIQYESLLKTSVTVDVEGAGEIGLPALMALLEKTEKTK